MLVILVLVVVLVVVGSYLKYFEVAALEFAEDE